MMPAAKHGDPQLGVDIHMCTVPPSPSPVPLPTPHTSIVFDPFDYVPILGGTVTVCGMKRATAGTNATAIHIPPGFPFVPSPKLPEKDDELFMGSATVVADGEPFSFTAVPVLSCQVAGMLSPPRIKKSGPPKAMVLPTTVNLAIPTNVVVGGPPTISLMGMAFRLGFAALGRFARSNVFRRMRRWVADRLGARSPGFLRCIILRAEPVNILNGSVSVEQQDFNLPGCIPIEWSRNYRSDNSHKGVCGVGWETLVDTRMLISAEDNLVHVYSPGFGLLTFNQLPAAIGADAAELELMDGSLLVDHGDEFRVTTIDDRIYHFPKTRAFVDERGQQCWTIGEISDRCGNALTFQYQAGHVVSIIESTGRRLVLKMEHDRLMAVTLVDPTRDTEHTFVHYEYDSAGDLVAVRDALDHPYTFAYDTHHLIRHTDRKGLSFYYNFDITSNGDWRVVHAWGDGGLYDYHFEYFDVLNERRITDSLSHVTTIKLDENGLPISEIDPLGGMTIFEYDEVGRTTAVVDPDHNRSEYTYDERGNLVKLTRPDGACVETEFNQINKAAKITDPNGASWQQDWDARGLLTRQLSPLGAESRYEYDTHGQLIGFTNPLGARTALAFDDYGNLTQLTDALGHSIRFAYDMIGDVIVKTDPLGHRTTYGYDLKGRLRQASLSSGSTIACAYDNEDNLVRYIDENGAETRLEYFGIGEIKRRIQPDNNSVEYYYDTEERLIGVTNQRGETYQLKRNALGRIVEEIDYWGQARCYGYSGAGYLKDSTEPLGCVIHYETDPLGRILKKTLPNSVVGETPFEETFEYDANGNLTACVNPYVRIEREFDLEGRLVKEQQGDNCTVANAYDSNGNRISRAIAIELGERSYANTVHYRYDVLDQVVSVEIYDHDPLTFTRNALGQVIQEHLSKSVQRDFAYGADGYLTAQRVLSTKGPLFEQSYRYDRVGNLIEKHDSSLGIDQFSYDPLGRFVSHLNPEGRLKQYLNDPAGDRLRTRIAQRQQSEGSQAEWYREGEYDGTYYRFDLTGNLVERKGPMSDTRFIWDANQRLVESNKDSKATTYHYDPLARRISKETDGVVTRFFWDGDALAGDVVTGETLEPATSQLREWVYYPETFEPLVMVQNHGTSASEMYLYHNDPNGCPTRLLDTQGEVVWGARYSAWGGVEQLVVDRVDNPIRLQGQYYDKEFVLHYNRFRYFDTLIASFISLDPLGLKPGENPYSFAPNHWLWYDPLGLMCAARRRSLWQRIKDFFTGRRATKPISEVDEAAEDFMRRHFSPEEIEEAGRVRTVPGPRGTTRGGNRPRGRRTPGAENFDPDSLYRRKRKW